MRWDRDYRRPEPPINDPAIIPAYGVTDEERAYWNRKQEALEYDDYPHEYGEKILMSGVVWQALEDYKVQSIAASQAFFWGQVGGLAQTKEACEAAAETAVGAIQASADYAAAAEASKDEAAQIVVDVSGYVTAASNYATAAYNSKNAAADSATAAAGSVIAAQNKSYDSEAWAKGTRNGVDIASTDPAYHNNAKYYADQASTIGDVIKDNITSLYFTWSSTKISTELSNKIGLVDGKIPAAYLPSYVDDVVEGYLNALDGKFYEESTYETEITPEAGKIYSALDTNKTYRWGGSSYVQLNAGLALGETTGTAYEGSKGKANADNITAIQALIPNGASALDMLTIASDVTSAIITAFNGVTFTTTDNVIYINW